MTGRLAGDNHAYRIRALVHRLMLLAGRNLDPFTGVKDEDMMLDFER